MLPSTVALIIIGIMLVLYATELIPLAVTSLSACLALAVFGIIPLDAAFSGFGSDVTFLCVGMMVLGNALFETGIASLIGKKIVSVVGVNERVFIFAIMIVSTVLSLFLANTATVALMLPIAASAAAESGGRLTKKNTYMVIGMTTVVSGVITIVGSTPQLIAQSILVSGGHEPMGFFELSRLSIPLLALLFVYFQTIGFSMQKKAYGPDEAADEAVEPGEPGAREPKSVPKMITAISILVLCVAGFITGLWTMGIVAMAGASLCVVTGCIPLKTVFGKMDWSTVVILSSSFGIAAGLESSGAGRLIASALMNLLGERITPWLFCAAIAFVGMLFTNFMSSTAMASILVPIAVFSAAELGYDVKSVVILTTVAVSSGFATPVSTVPITMTLAGGYRFTDYLKVGGVFNILAYILLIALLPLFL